MAQSARDPDDAPGRGVRSVEEAARILNCFSAYEPNLGVSQIAERLQVPRSKVHRYLVSLERAGLVRRDPATRRYTLGLRLLALGQLAASGVDVVALLDRWAGGAAPRLGHTLVASLVIDGALMIVRQYESGDPRSVLLRPGQLPLTSTAQGKVFLAFSAPAERTRLLAADPASLAALDGLEVELEAVRQVGFAHGRGEFMAGLAAVAVPVFDHNGRVAAALAAVDFAERFTLDVAEAVGRDLVGLARATSRELGFAGQQPGIGSGSLDPLIGGC